MKHYFKVFSTVYNFKSVVCLSLIISILISILDIFNIPTYVLNSKIFFPVLLGFIFSIFNFNFFKLSKSFKNKSLNKIDYLLFLCIIVCIFLLIYVVFFDFKLYKVVILSLIIFCSLLSLVYKIVYRIKNYENSEQNLLSLGDIISKKIDLNREKYSFLEEKEIEYDLLGRDSIINQVYNAIVSCSTNSTFTFGLNGKWGSGKTTIINNAIRLLSENNLTNKYIILKFDPWKYTDEKSLLTGFLDELLKCINYDDVNSQAYEMIHGIINVIFGSKYTGIVSLFNKRNLFSSNDMKISTIVNDYLETNNKNLIIVLDNLDRIDAAKAIFLIKCVESVINFKRTINILLYDVDLLNNFIEEQLHFHRNYMDKLVQLNIDVPEIHDDNFDYIKNKIASNLLYNGEPFLKFISNSCFVYKDLRSLKRTINSIISLYSTTPNWLSIEDYSKLVYIRSLHPELYYSIRNNSDYFIYYDRANYMNITRSDAKKLNTNARDYFDSLFFDSKYKDCYEVLQQLFPSVNNYFNNTACFPDYRDEISHHKSVVDKRIANSKYFDLYFTSGTNYYVKLNDDAKNMIKLINSKKTFKDDLQKILSQYDPSEMKIFMETFSYYIDQVNKDKVYSLITTIYDLRYLFNDRIMFLEVDSYQRSAIIISDLFKYLESKDLNKFKKSIAEDYCNLKYIEDIQSWIEKDSTTQDKHKLTLNPVIEKMCKNIFEKNIDIYCNEFYNRLNVWVLYRHDKNKVENYLKIVLNKDNVLRFISDVVSVSYGSKKYGYKVEKKNVELLISYNFIDKLISQLSTNLSEIEELLINLYNKSKDSKPTINKCLYLDEYIF